MMVRMGNACLCCLSRSSNMKSAMSSSSSGSDRASVSGVATSANDIEERKSSHKSTSRMSCASDDSCAINELLEGRMDLAVTLPNGANPIMINVERRTPMLDLLVNISTQYRFNAANYTINADGHEFKASTAIGTLDVNQISIIPKSVHKSASMKSTSAQAIPFQTTFRLQVNLPRNQLMVMRVSPNATIAAIKQIICTEKALDANKYKLVRFSGKSHGPQVLEANKTLAFYTINEVSLISNKSLAQIELQYGNPSSSDVTDMSTARSTPVVEPAVTKSMNSLIISQSNPDFSTMSDKTVLNHKSTKNVKKRPAPPPPTSSSATLPNKSFSLQKSSNKEENAIQTENESNVRLNDNVSTISDNVVQIRAAPKVHKSVTHVRHNSGSDSSGYHESVLSSDSPESSSATGLNKLGTQTASGVSRQPSAAVAPNQKANVKKRRAPPPPPTNQMSENSSAKPINGINDVKHTSNDGIIDESKVVSECMSDVSLPLSTSSSSSGTASDMNNRSLSPIVITQDNGSSTPLQRSVIYNENSSNCESVRCSSASDKTLNNKSQEFNRTDNNESQQSFESKGSSESPESGISSMSVDNNYKEEIFKESNNSSSETTVEPSIEPSVEVSDDSNQVKVKDESESNCQSGESLNKEEVSSEAPAQTLAVSHEPDRSGHGCSQQVEEPNIANSIDYQKSSSNGTANGITDRIDSLHIFAVSNREPTQGSCMRSAYGNGLAVSNGEGCDCASSRDYGLRGHLDAVRTSYLHEMIALSQISLDRTDMIQTIETMESIKEEIDDNCSNETDIDPTLNDKQMDLESMSVPLPPPSPFQNSQHEDSNSLPESREECQPIVDKIEDKYSAQTLDDNRSENESTDRCEGVEQSIDETKSHKEDIEANDRTDSDNRSALHSPVNACDDDSLSREIEVTLNSLNEELNRLEEDEPMDNNEPESKPLASNAEAKEEQDNSSVKKQMTEITSKVETIKNKFERNESPVPVPSPRVISPAFINNERDKSNVRNNSPIIANGRTTLFISKSPSPVPSVSPSPVPSVSPTNEDKVSITDEVRQICRPRVRLTNFSIGSFKKDVDIYNEVPSTAPVVKSFTNYHSLKREDKIRPSTQVVNKSRSEVDITNTSTTAITTTVPKPKTPVIHTLTTSAPRISRIQSWSGQKSAVFEQKNVKQPVKSNERYISQIAINKANEESKENSQPTHPTVQSLVTKTEDKTKHISTVTSLQKPEMSNIEKITISIKPGLESIIRSNSRLNTSEGIKNYKNLSEIKETEPKAVNSIDKPVSKSNTEVSKASNGSPVPPPVPPPIPPPVPQAIPSLPTSNSLKNPKIFHPKGWSSDNARRSGTVPKVKHVEPPASVNVRDQLLNEIKGFGGKNSLKKVSNNSSWKLEVNPIRS